MLSQITAVGQSLRAIYCLSAWGIFMRMSALISVIKILIEVKFKMRQNVAQH